MKKAIVSIANSGNSETFVKNHKYYAYSNNYKHALLHDSSEIFSLWNKFDTILIISTNCIINNINHTIFHNFLNNNDKNLLIGSIEHIPISFDSYIVKTTTWSKIFLSDILRKKIYIDEYIEYYGAQHHNIKQIMVEDSFRSFSGQSDHMIYNTVMEPLGRQLTNIELSHKKLGII